MKIFCFGRKLQYLCNPSMLLSSISSCFHQFGSIRMFLSFFHHVLFHQVNPFFIQLFYFLFISLFGFFALSVTTPRNDRSSTKPKSFDIFFTSVSAATDSSMATVEMEVFSNFQLIIITILMFLGGEVFISMLGLQLKKSNFHKNYSQSPTSENTVSNRNLVNQVELRHAISSSETQQIQDLPNTDLELSIAENSTSDDNLKYNSIRYLSYVVLGYLLVVHIVGSGLASLYVSFVPSARQVIEKKNLTIQTFCVFTVVSTFTNCGFIPTNENMTVFKKNSGLLLILIPQVLLGNTLYPTCLRLVIWLLNKIAKRREYEYLLKNSKEIGFVHLKSGYRSCVLGFTALGFLLVQLVLFCMLEWNDSEVMDGLNTYRRIIAALFQVTNTRYTGESVFDVSILSPAIQVLFVVMMYLPPYTSFARTRYDGRDSCNCERLREKVEKKITIMECLILSPLSYLAIFIILICITEREKMKDDPLNFSVLNITFEVISAYGNVGFSTGYSCRRQLKPDSSCRDVWIGFVGKWNDKAKFILIIVMFFGRLSNFEFKGGKAWKLS